MIVDWLSQISIEVSILILLVMFLRPWVRKFLGAGAAYGLWVVPLLRILLIERTERDLSLLNTLGVNGFSIDVYPSANTAALPFEFPWILLWITGMLAWAIYRVFIFLRFKVTLRHSSTPLCLSPELITAIDNKIEKPPKKISYLQSTLPGTPFVSGVINTNIYLPDDFFSRFSVQEQTWILLHEICHVRRKDLWVRFVCEIVRTLFWFNPLVHFSTYLVHKDQELACDQALLKNCSNAERYQYGKALFAGIDSFSSPSIMAFFNNRKERFTMLSKHKNSKLNTILGITLCTILSVFALTKAPTLIADDELPKMEPVTMHFEEMPIGEIMTLISEFSKINILMPDKFRKKVISVHLKDTPALKALEIIAHSNTHEIKIKNNVVYIVPSD